MGGLVRLGGVRSFGFRCVDRVRVCCAGGRDRQQGDESGRGRGSYSGPPGARAPVGSGRRVVCRREPARGEPAGSMAGRGWATRMASATLYCVLAVLLVFISVVFTAERLGTIPTATLGDPIQIVAGVVAGFGIGVVAAFARGRWRGTADSHVRSPLRGEHGTSRIAVTARVAADHVGRVLPLLTRPGVRRAGGEPTVRCGDGCWLRGRRRSGRPTPRGGLRGFARPAAGSAPALLGTEGLAPCLIQATGRVAQGNSIELRGLDCDLSRAAFMPRKLQRKPSNRSARRRDDRQAGSRIVCVCAGQSTHRQERSKNSGRESTRAEGQGASTFRGGCDWHRRRPVQRTLEPQRSALDCRAAESLKVLLRGCRRDPRRPSVCPVSEVTREPGPAAQQPTIHAGAGNRDAVKMRNCVAGLDRCRLCRHESVDNAAPT